LNKFQVGIILSVEHHGKQAHTFDFHDYLIYVYICRNIYKIFCFALTLPDTLDSINSISGVSEITSSVLKDTGQFAVKTKPLSGDSVERVIDGFRTGKYDEKIGKFYSDLETSKIGVNSVSALMRKLWAEGVNGNPLERIKENENARFDLKAWFSVSSTDGEYRSDSSFMIECKEDQGGKKTGNVAVEHAKEDGTPSGIFVSDAEMIVYILHVGERPLDRIVCFFRTEKLKEACVEGRYWRDVLSHKDMDNRAWNYLFRRDVFLSVAETWIDLRKPCGDENLRECSVLLRLMRDIVMENMFFEKESAV